MVELKWGENFYFFLFLLECYNEYVFFIKIKKNFYYNEDIKGRLNGRKI